MLQCFPSEIEKKLIVFSDYLFSRINQVAMFCFSRFTEDKGCALKLNMNPCEYLHNMYSDHSWISSVWFQMAHIYNCQTLLISLLLETSLNPVAFLISSVALDFWNPYYVRGVQHGDCWYSERVSLWEMSSLVTKLKQKNWVTGQSSGFYWKPVMCKPKLPLHVFSSEYSMSRFLQMNGIIQVHSIYLKHKACAVGLVLGGWVSL